MKAHQIRGLIDFKDINSIIHWHKYFTDEKFEDYFERRLNGKLNVDEYDELLDLYDYLNSRLAKEYIKLVEK